MDTAEQGVQSQRSRWLVNGLAMGIVAGIIFAMFEMIMAAILGDGFFGPLRMIGAIVLGPDALVPAYSLPVAALVGMVVHLVLSGIFGLIFGLIASSLRFVRASGLSLGISATIFGILLWMVNFYLIAPVAFPWFGMANPYVQFVSHAFFYGTALGLLLLARRLPAGVR